MQPLNQNLSQINALANTVPKFAPQTARRTINLRLRVRVDSCWSLLFFAVGTIYHREIWQGRREASFADDACGDSPLVSTPIGNNWKIGSHVLSLKSDGEIVGKFVVRAEIFSRSSVKVSDHAIPPSLLESRVSVQTRVDRPRAREEQNDANK
jgi:hypothetical protein